VALSRIDSRRGPLAVLEDNGLIRARGIPYAIAERFAAPTPLPPRTDLFDATERGPACPQLPSRLEFVTGAVTDGLVVS